jgi:N-acetylneuraminate lyase
MWICGSFGQFDALTFEERKQIMKVWIPAAKKAKVFAIIHIGGTSVKQSQELARFAESLGADAISAVPPFYEVCLFIKGMGGEGLS